MEIINARVKQKTDTEANWLANPLILLNGEQAFVVNGEGRPVNFKIGDGTKTFAELDYFFDYNILVGRVSAISPTDPAPTIAGVYIPTITDNATYTNAGNITVNTNAGGADYGRYPQLIRDSAGNWVKASTPLPQPDTSGIIAPGDTKAVSGDTVYKYTRADITNIALNSDFINGRTDWLIGTLITTWVAEGGTFKFTGVGTPAASNRQFSQIHATILDTDKVYMRAMVRGAGIVYIGRGIGNVYTSGVLTDQFQPFSDVFATASTRMSIAGSVGSVVEVDNVIIVNLTKAFGAGNEPSKAAMDGIINDLGGYFSGTKTFNPTTFSLKVPEKANHGYSSGEEIKTLKQVEMEGATFLEQFNVNGNFANGLAPWQVGSAITNVSVEPNKLIFTGAGIPGSTTANQVYVLHTPGDFADGDKIYFRIVARSNDAGILYLGTVNANQYELPIESGFTVLSRIIADNGTRFRIGSPAGTTVEVQSIMTINLTEVYGAGNEPTTEDMDALIELTGGYFEGVKTIVPDDYRKLYMSLIGENRQAIKNLSVTGGIGEISGIAAMGASLMYSGNTWFDHAATIAGVTSYNKAISGSQPYTFANMLWRGTYCTPEEFEQMDILAIQFASSSGLDITTDLLPDADDYVAGFDIGNPANQFEGQTHAQNVDYILKYWRDWCYAQKDNTESKWYGRPFGKPFRVIIVSHWHDGRPYYNDAIRILAARWGFVVCEFDKYIGFSKDQPFNGQQVSIMYAEDTQSVGGVVYGWHPLRGVQGRYIQKKMANIFYHAINQYHSMY